MNLFNPKGFSNIIVIVLILGAVIIIGGGIFLVISQRSQTNQNSNTNAGNMNVTSNQNLNAVVNKNNNFNTPTGQNGNENTNTLQNQNINASANTNATIDPTADWKTYRNEKYGFEVKYPKEWDYREYGKQAFFDVADLVRDIIPESEPPTTKVTITIDDSKNWNEWINKLKESLKFENYHESITAVATSISARKISGKVTGESYIKGKYYVGVLFNNGQNSYLLTYTYETLDFASVFNSVVASFNFTETADWKTYTHSDLYSVKYPNDWQIIQNPPNDISLQSADKERINVLVQNNSKKLTIDQWLQAEFPASYIDSFEDKVVDGKTGKINVKEAILYILLSDGAVLTVTYRTGEDSSAGVGTKNMNTFLQMINSIDIL